MNRVKEFKKKLDPWTKKAFKLLLKTTVWDRSKAHLVISAGYYTREEAISLYELSPEVLDAYVEDGTIITGEKDGVTVYDSGDLLDARTYENIMENMKRGIYGDYDSIEELFEAYEDGEI